MKFLRNDPTLKQRRRELRRDQTEAEKTLWAHLRNKQFYGMKFFRQYSTGPYILDFYSPTMKLAVELDGGQHNLCGNPSTPPLKLRGGNPQETRKNQKYYESLNLGVIKM